MSMRCETQPEGDVREIVVARARPAELWWRLVRSETLARLLRELVEGDAYDSGRSAQWSTTRSERVLDGVFSTDDLLALAESADSPWFGVALSLPVRVDEAPDPARIAAYNAELAAAVRERRLLVMAPSELTVRESGPAGMRQATLRAALSRSVNAVALARERAPLAVRDDAAPPRDGAAVMAERALARGAAHWLIDERRGRSEQDGQLPRRAA
jgi:hypothetical protein